MSKSIDQITAQDVYHTHGRGRTGALVALLVAGFAVPYAFAGVWVARHGADPARFLDDVLANPAAAFFAADVVIAAIALVVAALTEPRFAARDRTLAVAASLLGPSVGVPAHMLLRDRAASS